MKHNLKSLISTEEIKQKTELLGRKITGDFQSGDVIVVSPLKGAFIFCADLIRHIRLPMRIDFMELSSYQDGTVSSGKVKIIKDLTHDISGKHVILAEDILDTGLTVRYAMEILSGRNPLSLSLAVLLDKKKTEIIPDYTGFQIEDHFVVGYGMDYRGYYRNLDCVAVLDEESRMEIDRKLDSGIR